MNESTFRQSKQVTHLWDVPMFSVYYHNTLVDSPPPKLEEELDQDLNTNFTKHQNIFKTARDQITKMGFPSMHANVMIKDLTNHANRNTGVAEGGTGGWATRKGKYMALDYDTLLDNPEFSVNMVVHEWAHLWMFNNSKGFKKAVLEFYNNTLQQGKDQYEHKSKDRHYLINAKVEDEVFTAVVNGVAKMASNIYIFTLDGMNPANDDPYFKWDEAMLKDTVEKNIDHIVVSIGEQCTRSARQDDQSFSIYEDEELSLDWSEPKISQNIINIQQKIKDYFTDKLIKMINKSIDEDMWEMKMDREYEPEKDIPSVEDSYNWLIENETRYNKMFKFSKKDYDTVYYNYHDMDEQCVIIDLITEGFKDIMSQSEAFRIKERLAPAKNLSGGEWNNARDTIKDIVKWVDGYGMSNDDEIWATGVEKFMKLPIQHRKSIIKLMGTR